jgi:hypothetical protein
MSEFVRGGIEAAEEARLDIGPSVEVYCPDGVSARACR